MMQLKPERLRPKSVSNSETDTLPKWNSKFENDNRIVFKAKNRI